MVYLRNALLFASGFSKLLVADYSKTLYGKMNRHSRGTPATFASIPVGIPRSPRDFRHPHSRAGL